MISSCHPKDRLRGLLEGAWSTLGLPLAVRPHEEKKEGIIDVEALIAVSLLRGPAGRLETDVPAWLRTFGVLVNHQKLKAMVRQLPETHRESLQIQARRSAFFQGAPKAVSRALGIVSGGSSEAVETTLKSRQAKLSTADQVASNSLMIHHRLLYGTGFRADVIALTHVSGLAGKGARLARLLCTHDSTVSRILRDLRACGFLDADNERTQAFESYPGLFVSARTLWNLCEILDAQELRSERHREETIKALDFKQDGLGKKLSDGGALFSNCPSAVR